MPALVEIGGKRRFELKDRTTIGRHPLSEVCLTDGMVSLCHAEVRRAPDGKFVIVDVGSRHGTYLGSKRVTEAPLTHGDELLVGPVRLRFEDAPAPPSPADNEVARLRAMVDLSRAIGVEHDLQRLAERILDTAFHILPADRGAIMLCSPQTRRAFLTIARQRGGGPAEVAFSTSIVSEVMSRKAGLITSQADVDSRFSRSESIIGQGIRSVMYVPLLYQDDLLGLMHLDSMAAVNVFAPRDLELFSAIGGQAALAVQNALLVKQVQDVVAEEKKRLERVLESLPVGVMLLDADRKVELANAWAQERMHLLQPRPQPVGARFGTLEFERAAAGAATDVNVGTPRRTFSVSSNAFSDAGETVVVIRDVTDERERDARSAHKERLALIGQLAGGVAHDFNNLLMIILNYAGFVEAEVDDPDVRGDVAQIRQAAHRAAELTRQLLAFSRREAVKPRVVEPAKVVEGMEKMLRRALGEHIQLATRLAPDVPRVLVDPAKLEQVVLNLAVNARDAMPDGGKLVVEADAVTLDESAALEEGVGAGRYAVLRVIDAGVGMPPEVVAHVFEPFFTTKEQGKGTGLGLAMVYGIVTQAGGSITVRSRPEAGTTFQVYLPETTRAADAEANQALGAGGGKETILLAEDEEAVRRLTKRILVQAGYSVIDAPSGPEALDAAARHAGTIDLLVTDLVMPGMSGRELAQRLGDVRAGLRVVYMSGYFGENVPGTLPLTFLPKPFTREDLLSRVRDALAGARPTR